MLLLLREWKILRNKKKIQKNKILRRKSRSYFMRKKNLLAVTRVFRNLMNSFGNKSFLTLDWSSKSIKRHRRSSSCDQNERIRRIIFFCNEYYFLDCTPIFLISITILFALFLLLFCLHRRTFTKFVCTYHICSCCKLL